MKVGKIGVLGAAALAATALLFTVGCGNQTKTTSSADGTLELRWWCELKSYPATMVTNLGDTPLMQKLQEETNTKITFEHPPQGQAQEKFNILIASDNLPDVISYSWKGYGGGPEKAISDRLIVNLSEYTDHMPNLMQYLSENEEAKKQAYTDSGKLFSIPFIRGDESLQVSQGLLLRKDWLDELGLDVPETIDEWETVLTAFRDQKGAAAPLSITTTDMYNSAAFVGAYNTNLGFYVMDGQVKYGQATQEFKEFLTLMNDWYEKGLLDKDFATLDATTKDSNVLNGTSGAFVGSLGQHISRYISAAADEKFDLVGVASPVLNKSETPEFGNMQNIEPTGSFSNTAITVDCKNKERVAEFLDYGYSEAGHMLFNFGIEGESYEMINGYPTYTEKITNDPDNSMTVMLSQYTMSYDAGPFVQDVRYEEQYAALPQQQQAWNVWTKSNMKEHLLPPIYVDNADVNEIDSMVTAVETYAKEMELKVMMGVEPVSNYDAVIAEIEARGINTILEKYQAAYEKYLAR